jgi:hypothetical protein
MKIAGLIIAAAMGCAPVGARAAAPELIATNSAVDPRAVDALVKMSAYLRSIPAFQITLTTQRDDVDVYGQLITLSGGAVYSVRRPNAFAINLALPSVAARYVYDGKTVTVFDASAGVYATYQAPGTIRDTLETARQKYGAEVPLEDLFTWSDGDSATKGLTVAHVIGKSQIGRQSTTHYAFRQPGADWQIWIADGAQPIPLRVVIVSSKDPARPQFRADLAWNTAPQFPAGQFTFVPPANARAVDPRPSR